MPKLIILTGAGLSAFDQAIYQPATQAVREIDAVLTERIGRTFKQD